MIEQYQQEHRWHAAPHGLDECMVWRQINSTHMVQNSDSLGGKSHLTRSPSNWTVGAPALDAPCVVTPTLPPPAAFATNPPAALPALVAEAGLSTNSPVPCSLYSTGSRPAMGLVDFDRVAVRGRTFAEEKQQASQAAVNQTLWHCSPSSI